MKNLLSLIETLLENRVGQFVVTLVIISFLMAAMQLFFRGWKIQPNGFQWKVFRREIFFSAVNMAFSGFLLGSEVALLTKHNFIEFNQEPASWWVVALEYALYFVLFDTWFYWLHRLMHKGRAYTFVHKIHHLSTSPNLLTTLSVNPLESLINGGFVPLFTAVFTIHNQTMPFIGATNILMGLYVHCGYELLPRWWNKSWLTKWFITATFHDQHHKYFRWNFGGYTTIWDRICGTVRPRYESDFEKIKLRHFDKVQDTDSAVTASSSGFDN